MNKTGFIEELQTKTGCKMEQCVIINDVLENHFIFRKKNKPIVVAELAVRLSIDEAQAEKIYDQAMEIISLQIKKKKRHPFGENK